MTMRTAIAAAFAGLVALAPTSAGAAPVSRDSIFAREPATALHQVQHRGREGYYRGGGPGYYRGGGPGYYRGGGPGYYRGGPGWGYRPWYGRPYYGTIIGGIALGSIIAVTAYGLAPPRPRPDLCWYWTSPDRNRGYWDYC